MALEENNLIMADADARADVVDDPKIKKPHKSAVGIEGAACTLVCANSAS